MKTKYTDSQGRSYDAEPEDDHKCSISLDLYEDPVLVLGSGNTYERANIAEWLSDHDIDPMTGEELLPAEKRLVPNRALKRCIVTWKEQHIIAEQANIPTEDPAASAPTEPDPTLFSPPSKEATAPDLGEEEGEVPTAPAWEDRNGVLPPPCFYGWRRPAEFNHGDSAQLTASAATGLSRMFGRAQGAEAVENLDETLRQDLVRYLPGGTIYTSDPTTALKEATKLLTKDVVDVVKLEIIKTVLSGLEQWEQLEAESIQDCDAELTLEQLNFFRTFFQYPFSLLEEAVVSLDNEDDLMGIILFLQSHTCEINSVMVGDNAPVLGKFIACLESRQQAVAQQCIIQ